MVLNSNLTFYFCLCLIILFSWDEDNELVHNTTGWAQPLRLTCYQYRCRGFIRCKASLFPIFLGQVFLLCIRTNMFDGELFFYHLISFKPWDSLTFFFRTHQKLFLTFVWSSFGMRLSNIINILLCPCRFFFGHMDYRKSLKYIPSLSISLIFNLGRSFYVLCTFLDTGNLFLRRNSKEPIFNQFHHGRIKLKWTKN